MSLNELSDVFQPFPPPLSYWPRPLRLPPPPSPAHVVLHTPPTSVRVVWAGQEASGGWTDKLSREGHTTEPWEKVKLDVWWKKGKNKVHTYIFGGQASHAESLRVITFTVKELLMSYCHSWKYWGWSGMLCTWKRRSPVPRPSDSTWLHPHLHPYTYSCKSNIQLQVFSKNVTLTYFTLLYHTFTWLYQQTLGEQERLIHDFTFWQKKKNEDSIIILN